MDEREISSELHELARRLRRIEQHLGLTPGAEPERPRSAEPPVATPVPTDSPRPQPRAEAPAALPQTPATSSAPTESIVADADRRGTALEILIGERWMAWVGAIVVVVAVGFFVKLAYDLGWWGRLTPLAKCLITATFGGLLIVAGEVALRRVGRVAAVSLYGAGLGTLYLTAYATFRYFKLLPPAGAFWLMAAVAVLGVGLTLRGRLVSIGVLSLLGGYLSPILLAEQVTFPAALPLYLTALLAVALCLSAALPDPFRPLRYVALVAHAVVAAIWVSAEGTTHWLLAMTFMSLWWAMVNAEALLAAFRGQSARGNAVATLFFTLWYVSAGCNVLSTAQPGQRDWLGLFAGAVAAVCAWLALPFGPGLAVLKHRPRRAVERFVVTLWAQVGVLVAAAIALQFRDPNESFGQTIGWLAMTVACVEVGRRLPSRGVTIFGLLVGLLALVRVWFMDPHVPILQPTLWRYGDVCVNGWSLLVLGAIGATHFAALRVLGRDVRPALKLGTLLSVLSVVQWLALCAAQCQELALTAGWLVAVAALLAAAPLMPKRGYIPTALVVLVLAAVKWLLIDATAGRGSASWSATAPVVNWPMAVAVAIAACGWLVYWRWTPRRASDGADDEARAAVEAPIRAQVPLFGALVFLLLALSFEVDRAVSQYRAAPGAPRPLWPTQQELALWWTLLWAAGGLIGLIYGHIRRQRVLLQGGYVLGLLAATVWLLFDTLACRMEHGVILSAIVLNLQFVAGLVVAGVVGTMVWLLRRGDFRARGWNSVDPISIGFGLGTLVATGLWLGSLELDRYFAPEARRVADPAMARQTALSIYWGLYAIALVGLGFWRRMPLMRYVGLGLLALTLGKVLVVDLAHIRYVYRVLSLLAVGLLFIATSVAYARLASRLRDSAR